MSLKITTMPLCVYFPGATSLQERVGITVVLGFCTTRLPSLLILCRVLSISMRRPAAFEADLQAVYVGVHIGESKTFT